MTTGWLVCLYVGYLVGCLVGDVTDYSFSCSFTLEQFAVQHSGKLSIMSREWRGSCCVDRVISGYVKWSHV